MDLNEMRLDSARKHKKGLHFILASVFIWAAVLFIHLSDMHILMKNLLTFFVTAPLIPLAFLISKIIKVDFMNKDNPLTNLGIIFSANQMLYLLIAIWIYNAVPDKMVMILAMIFGAHLLPYGWLYRSKTYFILSALIPVAAFFVGTNYSPQTVAGLMIAIEIVFSGLLVFEIKNLGIRKSIKDYD